PGLETGELLRFFLADRFRQQGNRPDAPFGNPLGAGYRIQRPLHRVPVNQIQFFELLLDGQECLVRIDGHERSFSYRKASIGTRWCASLAASLTASTRLPGSATPLPTMSKAVPWSTDVRMIGSPTVRFTQLPKATIFRGINP